MEGKGHTMSFWLVVYQIWWIMNQKDMFISKKQLTVLFIFFFFNAMSCDAENYKKKNIKRYHQEHTACLKLNDFYTSETYRVFHKFCYHKIFKIKGSFWTLYEEEEWSFAYYPFTFFGFDDDRNDPKFSDRYAWANSADPDQTAPRLWSGSTLFASLSASFGHISLW